MCRGKMMLYCHFIISSRGWWIGAYLLNNERGLSDGEIENAKQVIINMYLENLQKENMCRWWLNWITYADQS